MTESMNNVAPHLDVYEKHSLITLLLQPQKNKKETSRVVKIHLNSQVTTD